MLISFFNLVDITINSINIFHNKLPVPVMLRIRISVNNNL